MERKQRAHYELTAYRAYELLFGQSALPPHDIGPNYYDGYVTGPGKTPEDCISDEMRQDWQRHRKWLVAFWDSGEYTTEDTFPGMPVWLFDRGYPDRLPWAARVFDGVRVENPLTEASTA
jgi:hypothetical protein